MTQEHLPERAAVLASFVADESRPVGSASSDPAAVAVSQSARPSVSCAIPNRSTFPQPKCRRSRRCSSAGDASCTASSGRKAPSASAPEWLGRRKRRRRANYFRVEDAAGTVTGSTARAPRGGGSAHAGSCTGLCVNARIPPPYVEFGVQSNFRPAWRLAAGGTRRHRLPFGHCGHGSCRSQHGGGRGARLEPVQADPALDGSAAWRSCLPSRNRGSCSRRGSRHPRPTPAPAGLGHLCRMLTEANMRGGKGAPDLRLADLRNSATGFPSPFLPELGERRDGAMELLQRMGSVSAAVWRIAVAPTIAATTASGSRRPRPSPRPCRFPSWRPTTSSTTRPKGVSCRTC